MCPRLMATSNPNYSLIGSKHVLSAQYLKLKARKVSFAAMKLMRQVSQYWTNFETLDALRLELWIDSWVAMKGKLMEKYATCRIMPNC